ncbi:MAG: T9SS type A sorting domain-containing protein [Crocinitomicaceae bacterium]
MMEQNLSVTNYQTQVDTINLHRRDYNMTMQVFPDGTRGYTAWSGVFDYNDAPYLNCVDITPTGYTVNNNFNQYLSQYHSAKMPVWDVNANAMHTFFFGGMSQFKIDSTGALVEDTDVPFVNTISKITRFSDGSMTENYLGYVQMPALVGAGSEFVPVRSYYDEEMLLINNVPTTKTLVGYVFGGIHSSDENIFFVNDGSQSWASNVIFKVYINKGMADVTENELSDHSILNMKIYPNPVDNQLNLKFHGTKQGDYEIGIVDMNGKVVKTKTFSVSAPGTNEAKMNVSKLSKGTYTITITNGVHTDHTTFIKQ